MNVKELNKVVVKSDNLEEVKTVGQNHFCEAYKEDDCSTMSYLLSNNIGINKDVKEVILNMFKSEDYNLYYLLSADKVRLNKDYKGDNIFRFLLNFISVNFKLIEKGSYCELILVNVLRKVNYDDLNDITLFNILKNPVVSKYLYIFKNDYIDLSKICILELDSRSGDDCFIEDFAGSLVDKYDIIPVDILSREECKSLYTSIVSNRIKLSIATLYPEEFVCSFNEDNADYIGFTEEEIESFKENGIKLISLKDNEKYNKFFS